jgi:hypothetical protein
MFKNGFGEPVTCCPIFLKISKLNFGAPKFSE